MEPHFVSQGSQKNFIHYTKKINDLVSKNKLLGENFYKKLIVNAILFKTTDKLFGRKNVDAIGETNLKAFSVAYTLSYFHFLTENRLDLWRIYEEQKTEELLNIHLKKLLSFVYEHLVREAKEGLISEYAKRVTSWEKLKQTSYSEDLCFILKDFLISTEEKQNRENEKELDTNDVEKTIFVISEIHKMGLKFWDGLKIYLSRNPQENFNEMLLFDLFKKLKERKNLVQREISFGKKVLDFISQNPELIDAIKSLSKLEDSECVEIKVVYDRLLLISKEEWKRIIALSEQTKIFSTPELTNVKSVQTALAKREIIKEKSLITAYESLKKLKKFGIKV